jgi:hypothetical protein
MTKEAILELRACAAMQLLCKEDKMKLFSSASAPSQIATVAIMGLEATHKKLIALKSLTVIQDDGSWPAI